MKPQTREVALVVIFTILTCGIYYWYWVYCTSRDIQRYIYPDTMSPGMEVFLGIITGGIYGWYWMYKYNKKLQTAPHRVPTEDNTVLCVVFAVLELPVVSAAVMQNQLNRIWSIG